MLSLLSPRARRYQHWLADHGFSAVLASRLAPGVPSGIVNYLAGVTGIRTRAVLAAVALGALPKTIAYVALGGALADPFSVRGLIAVGLYAAAAARRAGRRPAPHPDASRVATIVPSPSAA